MSIILAFLLETAKSKYQMMEKLASAHSVQRMCHAFEVSRSSLVLDAFQKTIETKGIPNELIFHSDQGTQYGSDEFKQMLNKYGVIQSMSRKGNCYDNAPMESFFHTLKSELSSFGKFNSRKQAEPVSYTHLRAH